MLFYIMKYPTQLDRCLIRSTTFDLLVGIYMTNESAEAAEAPSTSSGFYAGVGPAGLRGGFMASGNDAVAPPSTTRVWPVT
jgi:hypothetical protein